MRNAARLTAVLILALAALACSGEDANAPPHRPYRPPT